MRPENPSHVEILAPLPSSTPFAVPDLGVPRTRAVHVLTPPAVQERPSWTAGDTEGRRGRPQTDRAPLHLPKQEPTSLFSDTEALLKAPSLPHLPKGQLVPENESGTF